MSNTTSTITAPSQAAAGDQPETPTLLLDGQAYGFEGLSERARMLSLDFVRTEQEWTELQHRYRQFLAMEATVVNQLKEAVEQADLEPVDTGADRGDSSTPLLTIDATSYDVGTIPDPVRLVVEDLVRNNQERSQLEFRLRQLDAARTAFLGALRQELEASGAQPIPTPEAGGQA